MWLDPGDGVRAPAPCAPVWASEHTAARPGIRPPNHTFVFLETLWDICCSLRLLYLDQSKDSHKALGKDRRRRSTLAVPSLPRSSVLRPFLAGAGGRFIEFVPSDHGAVISPEDLGSGWHCDEPLLKNCVAAHCRCADFLRVGRGRKVGAAKVNFLWFWIGRVLEYFYAT